MKRTLLFLLLGASGCRIETPDPDVRAPTTATEATTTKADPAVEPISGDSARTEARASGSTPPDSPARIAPGGFVVPVLGVRPEDLVDTFDDARSEGRIHDALDIMAPRGTPVVAMAAGTVARLFESERGGLTVYVLDGTTVYYYAHLDAYAPGLAAGQTVVAGARLGTVGSTGNASEEAPHLHLAVWRAPSAEAFWDGEPLNPYTLLVAPR